jgi:LytTr DNA-binding domain
MNVLILSQTSEKEKYWTSIFEQSGFNILDKTEKNIDLIDWIIWIPEKDKIDNHILEKYQKNKTKLMMIWAIYEDEPICPIQNIEVYMPARVLEALLTNKKSWANHDDTTMSIIVDGAFFKVKNRLEKICFDDILWIQAKDVYSVIRTRDARFLVSHTLREIDERFPHTQFQRVHKSYMVNLKNIEAIEDKNLLLDEEYIPIGQAYREVLMKRLLIF